MTTNEDSTIGPPVDELLRHAVEHIKDADCRQTTRQPGAALDSLNEALALLNTVRDHLLAELTEKK